MDDYDDGDYLDMDGYEWFYVEDDYELADELAEGVNPDPGYIIGYEIAEYDNDDPFNYHDDEEYGDDGYWDTAGPRPAPFRQAQTSHTVETSKTGSKRKRNSEKAPSSKRQKRSAPGDRASQPVTFVSMEERLKTWQIRPPLMQSRATFALLPDWRERYKDTEGLITSKPMPPSMAKAIYSDELGDEEDLLNDQEEDLLNDQEEDEEDEGEGEDSWESEADDAEGALDIDPDTLKTILAQKLAEAGISGDEEASFMQSINDMLSGEGKGEAAAAMLEKALSGGGQKRKADSAVGLEPKGKKGKSSE